VVKRCCVINTAVHGFEAFVMQNSCTSECLLYLITANLKLLELSLQLKIK
jgi:hypothetical protein